MKLSGIFIYPVKSLRGISVSSAEIDELGFVGDRRFLVVDETGRFLTQRTLPRMALVATALTADTLVLSTEGRPSLSVSRHHDPSAPLRAVSVWNSHGLSAEDCGDEAASWLATFLGVVCRLVRIGPAFHRKSTPNDLVNFADGYPFLVIGEASLGDLNDRLIGRGDPALPMNRFRPNLVVSGSPAFAEDVWSRVRIGEVVLRDAGPCARCVVTTTDQLTTERGPEPLRTLATYRRDTKKPTEVNFGQNLVHETKRGTLRVGDAVEVLS